MKKNRGFTLIELIIVIVILGILAITAAPRFVNVQDNAHESRAKAFFSSITTSVNIYHGAWVLQGEPSLASAQGVTFSDSVIYPSDQGYPLGTTYRSSGITGAGCGELLSSLLSTDLTTEPYINGTMFPTEADVKYWYSSSKECIYYYTSNMDQASPKGYRMLYSTVTGETTVNFTPFPK